MLAGQLHVMCWCRRGLASLETLEALAILAHSSLALAILAHSSRPHETLLAHTISPRQTAAELHPRPSCPHL